MRNKRAMMRIERAMMRNEIDEPAVKGIHLNLYDGEIELTGKTRYHLLVSKLGKKKFNRLFYCEITMWCTTIDYVGVKLTVFHACCLPIIS